RRRRPPPFPYTTLFRSELGHLEARDRHLVQGGGPVAGQDVPEVVALQDAGVEIVERRGQADQAERLPVQHLQVEAVVDDQVVELDRKSTRLNSSHVKIS